MLKSSPLGDNARPSRIFRISYLAALSIIAVLTIVGQYLIHHTIANQDSDGVIINLSGRQRYTSQRIVKCMFILAGTRDSATFASRKGELAQAVATWQRSHNAFLNGDEGLKIHNRNNTDDIDRLFAHIQPHFDTVVACAQGFLATATPPQEAHWRSRSEADKLQSYLNEVVQHELPFLVGMDAIVKAYADVSHQKVVSLARIEVWLAVIMIITLLLEAFLIFRPALRAMKRQFHQITDFATQTREAHDQLHAKHEELTWKNAYIEKLMQATTQSIHYAQRIQHSLMPSEVQLRQSLPHLFLYYKPRDIVSGDFYWFKEQGDKIYLAVADCTGHGVPGCLMSVLGINLLSDVVEKYPSAEPHVLLEELDKRITAKMMAGAEHEVEDGMDIALCCINRAEMKLAFASAKQPLFLIRDGELLTYKGARRSLGNPDMRRMPFETEYIDIDADDFIYLFSDGVIDQFSDDDRRYGSHRLREFLLNSSAMPFESQHDRLSHEMAAWQQGARQTDDMLLIGLRVTPEGVVEV